MRVHPVNPSALSFGIGVIAPRWLYVLAAAPPEIYGDPLITDETLHPLQLDTISSGDIVNIDIATDSARVNRAAKWTRWMPKPCQRSFAARLMPELESPSPGTYG
jgi:hypothetical protein